jgi:hypothetical protein
MKTTLPDDDDPSVSEWCVFIAGHADEALVGTRRALLRGARLELGRDDDALGPGALADARVSRKHARIEVDAAGALRVADLGSSNGTFVNGARVELVTLAPGDLVRIGGLLLVVQRAPVHLRAVRGPLAGVGPALARMQAALDAAAAARRDVALVDEPGAGGVRVARAIARAEGETCEFSLAPWSDRLPVPLEERARAERGGCLALTSLPPKATLARSLVRDLLARRAGPSAPRCVLVCDAGAPADLELAHALGAVVVAVPALRERPEDLPFAARAWAAERGVPVPSLSQRGWTALLRAPWPGNLAQLEATLERAVKASTEGQPEDVERWIAESARSEATPWPAPAAQARATPAPAEPVVTFAMSGRWFVLPGGERVSLHRREVLARVLAALVKARVEHPGRVVRAEQLIERAWPGERLVEGSGENRLHVALTNLRQLGLRALLARVEDGYRIDPEVAVAFVDE